MQTGLPASVRVACPCKVTPVGHNTGLKGNLIGSRGDVEACGVMWIKHDDAKTNLGGAEHIRQLRAVADVTLTICVVWPPHTQLLEGVVEPVCINRC